MYNIYQLMNESLIDKDKLLEAGCLFGTAQSLDCVGESCPITYHELSEMDDTCKLPCQHIFEQKSILFWLQNKKTECPVCKKKVINVEVQQLPSEEDFMLGLASIVFMQDLIESLVDNENRNRLSSTISALAHNDNSS